MKIIKPSHTVETPLNGDYILKHIERAGRTCYKSEHAITPDSAEKFVANIIKRGHESVLEHFSFTVRFVCDRGVSHELVRHRLASFSQESTRYANYSDERFGTEITVIEPCFLGRDTCGYSTWKASCEAAEASYFRMLEWGCTPQEARSVLPNSLKTEVVVTANLREWRHILRLRTSRAAHPQIREIMVPLLKELREIIPAVFDDI
jgi:thymidylate synthase (FAD)